MHAQKYKPFKNRLILEFVWLMRHIGWLPSFIDAVEVRPDMFRLDGMAQDRLANILQKQKKIDHIIKQEYQFWHWYLSNRLIFRPSLLT